MGVSLRAFGLRREQCNRFAKLRDGLTVGGTRLCLLAGALVKQFTAPVVLSWNGVLLALLAIYFLVGQRKVAGL